jgi:20S proteasome alpha/beta subunit
MLALKLRPAFRPKFRRLPKENLMTIAAGFICTDGIVLCADTQEVIYSYAKVNTEKMRQLETPAYNVVFTGAGDTGLLETTIQLMEQALLDKKPSHDREIEKVLRDSLLETFSRHVAPYANFPQEDRPTADILIGIQYPTSTSLYRAYGTSFLQVTEPQCIGSGVVLGKSLIAQLFDSSMTIGRGWLIALYVLNQAKTWVDGCGGNTDILLLSAHNKGITRIPTTEVEDLESHFKQFDAFVRPLFMAVADRNVPHEKYEQLVKRFRLDMLGLRGKFMEYEEFFRRLCELQGVAYPLPETIPEL